MPIVAPPNVTIAPATHRFFDELVTAIAAQATTVAGYVTHAQGTPYRFLDDWTMRMSCLTRREARSTLEVEVQPASVLTPLTKFSWPTSVDLRFAVATDVTEPPPPAEPYKADLVGMQRLGANVAEHAFVTFYENVSDLIQAQYGDVGNRPATLQFARTVRNAFAHGGTLNITDLRPNTGTWNGLTYTAVQNGRRLMFNDLSLGDLALLMLDMNALLP